MSIEGLDHVRALQDALDRTAAKLAGPAMREPLERVLDVIETDIEERIDKGIDMTDKRMKSLSKAYKKQKERQFPGMPILKRTGAMLAGANVIRSIEPLLARLRYVVPYAQFHQFEGVGKVWRPFAGVSKQADKAALDVIGQHLDREILSEMNK